MLKMFRKRLKIEAVAADIIEDFLDTQLLLINELFKNGNFEDVSIENSEETVAFVYVIAIFGVQTSTIKYAEKHEFCMAITDLWSNKLVRPKWEAVPFLQRRLKEYRNIQDPTRLIQKYMERLGMDGPKQVAFLAAMLNSVLGRIDGIGSFIDEVSKRYNFA